MSAYCFPCLAPCIIIPDQENWEPNEQDNQWSNYLKAVSEEFVSQMKVPFGTYPKAHFYIHTYDKQRPLFTFVSTIYTDEQAIKILKTKADKVDYLRDVRYSIMKRVGKVTTVLFQRERMQSGKLTEEQKEFVIENEGKIGPMKIAKILNVSRWVIYGHRGSAGLVKHKTYHGNRKKQDIL